MSEIDPVVYLLITVSLGLLGYCCKLILDKLLLDRIKKNEAALVELEKTMRQELQDKLQATEMIVVDGQKELANQMRDDKKEILELLASFQVSTVSQSTCSDRQKLMSKDITGWIGIQKERGKADQKDHSAILCTLGDMADKLEVLSGCITKLQHHKEC